MSNTKKPDAPRRFRVLNPLGHAKGVPIITFRDVHYYEGQVFTLPEGMNPTRTLLNGYIEEVNDG